MPLLKHKNFVNFFSHSSNNFKTARLFSYIYKFNKEHNNIDCAFIIKKHTCGIQLKNNGIRDCYKEFMQKNLNKLRINRV
jgi:hypothetical protein